MNLKKILTVPLGFPILSQTVFPGDRIFLVPDAEYAGESEILAEITDILIQNGLNAENITILVTDAEEKSSVTELKKRLPTGVQIRIHRPGQREQLALLGVNASDKPIFLFRELIDADMVISIGRFYTTKKPKDYFGVHSAIFPRFSESVTQHRFAESKGTQRRKLDEEVQEAARLLGVFFTIQFHKERGKTIRAAAGLPELVTETLQKNL
jgi:nickel-dependent lactate racemase